MEKKIIVAAFFPIYPITFGSSVVISSFFEGISIKNKVLFQISDNTSLKDKKIVSVSTLYQNKLFKLLSVIILILKVIKELFIGQPKKILIIEGASWIGYAFLLVLITNIIFPSVIIIYRGHSIEYEIRKKNSNFLISTLSYYFEKYVYKNTKYSTSVSSIEQNKIKNLYGVKTIIFPNVINLINKKKN